MGTGRDLSDGVIALGPLTLDDIDAHLAGEDAALVRWLNGRASTRASVRRYVLESQRAWRVDGPRLTFGVRVLPDAILAGTIDVHLALPVLTVGQANLAYGLYPGARGHGYATRAVLLACAFLVPRPDVHEAVVRVDPLNSASAAVAVRAGFAFSHHDPGDEGGLDHYVRAVTAEAAN